MSEVILEEWRRGLLNKLRRVVLPGEPIWLLKEELLERDELLVVTVVSRWEGQWLRRRYSYDYVGDVLHFRGQVPVTHDDRRKLKSEQFLDLNVDGASTFPTG